MTLIPEDLEFPVLACTGIIVAFLLLRVSMQLTRIIAMKEFDALKPLVPAACAALKAKDAQIADLTAKLATAQADAVNPADVQNLTDQLTAAGITAPAV